MRTRNPHAGFLSLAIVLAFGLFVMPTAGWAQYNPNLPVPTDPLPPVPGATGAGANSNAASASGTTPQTIFDGMVRQQQQQQAERRRIQQEMQIQVFQVQQDVTANAHRHAARSVDEERQIKFIRGGGASGGSAEGAGGGTDSDVDESFDPAGLEASGDSEISGTVKTIDQKEKSALIKPFQGMLDKSKALREENQASFKRKVLGIRTNDSIDRADAYAGYEEARAAAAAQDGNLEDSPEPPYNGPLFTYEEYLDMPVFVYTSTHQDSMIWHYAPQGPDASRAGTSGYDAAPNVSRRGNGLSSAGLEGSMGGLYPLMSDIYSRGREFNSPNAQQMAAMLSRAGAFNGIDDGNLQLAYVDPAIRMAILNGMAFNILHSPNQQPVPPGVSSGGFSNVTLILPLLFRIFDFGVQDGDNITLNITDNTGLRYTDTFNLTNAGVVLAPAVNPGQITLSVHANNEGSLTPNTGQIDILSTVTSGATTQQFNLHTGETGVMVIIAGPP